MSLYPWVRLPKGATEFVVPAGIILPVERNELKRMPSSGGRRSPKWLVSEALIDSTRDSDIVLALVERVLAIDDKNGINACKLLGVTFTTATGMLVRMREKRLLTTSEALGKLGGLAKHGRYKESILEDARRKLGQRHDEDNEHPNGS